MNVATALLVASVIAASPDPPVKVAGVVPEYCPDEKVIEMVVENASGSKLLVSIAVERLDAASGRWREYAPDVLGTDAHPKKVGPRVLAKGESLEIRWRPRVGPDARRLREGSYRIVANAAIDDRPPAERIVVAEFAVRPAPGCPKARPDGKAGRARRAR
jgi:hypothetical protein